MISSFMMWSLIGAYVGIAIACAYEHKWPMVLYWVGAAILNTAVIWGMNR